MSNKNQSTRDYDNWRRGPGPQGLSDHQHIPYSVQCFTNQRRPSNFRHPNGSYPNMGMGQFQSQFNPRSSAQQTTRNPHYVQHMTVNPPPYQVSTGLRPSGMGRRIPPRPVFKESAPKQIWAKANQGDPIQQISRKVTALLNKLTDKNFDSISGQILEKLQSSQDSKQADVAKDICGLIFKKALDEHKFCELYARLVNRILQSLGRSSTQAAWTSKPEDRQAIFRKSLLDQCEAFFNATWPKEVINDEVPLHTDLARTPEPEFTDEYYKNQKIKRHRLGLIGFVGELFKSNVVAAKIVDVICHKLLTKVKDANEVDIECACALITKVGPVLDNREPRPLQFERYIQRMGQIADCQASTSRIKFMIMDILDLRARGWTERK